MAGLLLLSGPVIAPSASLAADPAENPNPALVAVPDVVDMPEAEAIAAVSAAGLVPNPVTVEDDFLFGWGVFDESQPVAVLATESDAGQLAAAGSTVELWLPPELAADERAPTSTAQLVHTPSTSIPTNRALPSSCARSTARRSCA